MTQAIKTVFIMVIPVQEAWRRASGTMGCHGESPLPDSWLCSLAVVVQSLGLFVTPLWSLAVGFSFSIVSSGPERQWELQAGRSKVE